MENALEVLRKQDHMASQAQDPDPRTLEFLRSQRARDLSTEELLTLLKVSLFQDSH